MTEQWFCIDPKDCMCGGDTRAVRQTCSNYRSLRVEVPNPRYELPPGLLGPVVPSPEPERLTLRDQFAMAALGSFSMKQGWNKREWITQSEEIAEQVYTLADAMIEARK